MDFIEIADAEATCCSQYNETNKAEIFRFFALKYSLKLTLTE